MGAIARTWLALYELNSTNKIYITPDIKVHGAFMGHTWVLSVPDGPNVGPMNLAIRDA